MITYLLQKTIRIFIVFKICCRKIRVTCKYAPSLQICDVNFIFSKVTIKTGNEKSVILYITCIMLVVDKKERIGTPKWNGKFRYSLALILRFWNKMTKIDKNPPPFQKKKNPNKQTNKQNRQTKQNKRNTGFLKIKFPFVRPIFN